MTERETATATVVKILKRTDKGRSFSREELTETGFAFRRALGLHLTVDKNKKTKQGGNVKILKQLLLKR